MREKIYGKMLKLGASYNTKVRTSEVVQVAVEGAEQLETYFGGVSASVFLCDGCSADLVHISQYHKSAVGCGAARLRTTDTCSHSCRADMGKRLLSRYWDQYTALGILSLRTCRGSPLLRYTDQTDTK